MRFSIGIVGRDGRNAHAGCFEDFGSALADALRALGHEVVDFKDPGRLIMFGANNLLDPGGQIPKDAIIFNTEQTAAVDRPEKIFQNHQQYRDYTVWDYASSNIVALHKLGLVHTVLCPVGYIQSMTKIAPTKEKDIDVLFYGSVNPRRRAILEALETSGLKVSRLFGSYGAERDQMIARSKVVLNLHYYEHGVFEIFRVSHLLANRACVVTEDGGRDPALEDFARRACLYVAPEQIVDACRMVCTDDRMRETFAESGYEAFRKTDLIENVRRALAASEGAP